MTFQWLRPRTIGLDGKTLAKARAYEAKHSLPGYPDEDPSPVVRDRVLAEIGHVPVLPCEAEEDGPDIDCLTCEDRGEFVPEFSDVLMPCPDCPRSDWTMWHELYDDMERGK